MPSDVGASFVRKIRRKILSSTADVFVFRFPTFRFRSFSFTLPVMLIMFTPVSCSFVVLLRKQLYRKPTATF